MMLPIYRIREKDDPKGPVSIRRTQRGALRVAHRRARHARAEIEVALLLVRSGAYSLTTTVQPDRT